MDVPTKDPKSLRSLLFTALVSATVSFPTGVISTLVTAQVTSAREKKAASENLKMAFAAEIHEIRECVRGPTRAAMLALRQGAVLTLQPQFCPRTIYKANANRLGEIRDAALTKQIVALYSMLDRTDTLGRAIHTGTSTYPGEAFQMYVTLMVGSQDFAALLDARLEAETGHIVDSEFPIRVGPKDVEDHDFAVRALRDLNGSDAGVSVRE